MIKKIGLNILILVVFLFAPLFYQFLHENDISFIKSNQGLIHVMLFAGSILLTFLNHKFRKQALEKKWVWVIFEIFGIIGLIYSAGILWLLFEVRHGIGF